MITYCDRPVYLGEPHSPLTPLIKRGCRFPARFALLRDLKLEAYLCGVCRNRIIRWSYGEAVMREFGLRVERIRG